MLVIVKKTALIIFQHRCSLFGVHFNHSMVHTVTKYIIFDVDIGQTYHLICYALVITRNVTQYDALLELYYHCKMCQAPQAYLEAESFVTHVQECHAAYYQPERQSRDDMMVLAYPPESKTTAAQVSNWFVKKNRKLIKISKD